MHMCNITARAPASRYCSPPSVSVISSLPPTYIYMYICMYVCMYVCVYVYRYIYYKTH